MTRSFGLCSCIITVSCPAAAQPAALKKWLGVITRLSTERRNRENLRIYLGTKTEQKSNLNLPLAEVFQFSGESSWSGLLKRRYSVKAFVICDHN